MFARKVPLSSVATVDFEQVNIHWALKVLQKII